MRVIFFWMMIVGFAGSALNTPDLKGRTIGALLTIVNFLWFYPK